MTKAIQFAKLLNDSLLRKEPDWLLERRISALAQITNLKMPTIQRFSYSDWPLLENQSLKYQRSEDNIDFDSNANLVQLGQDTLQVKLAENLKEKGVILTDIFTAIKNYPKLLHKYFMTEAVKFDEDSLTANHLAYFNSGVFIYLPKNLSLKEPIELELIQDSRISQNWNPHILIVADDNSQVKILQHLRTVGDKKNSASLIIEIIANSDSHVEFSSLEELSEKTLLYFNRRAIVKKDAHVEWAAGFMSSCDTIGDLDSELIGEGSYANSKAIAITTGNEQMAFNNRVTNYGPHSIGLINQRGVLLDDSKLIFNGIGKIVHGAHGSKADQQNRVLMMSDNAHGDANPLLLIDENDVIAAHAASVGPVDQIQLDYLMSRGIPYDQAQRMVIRGFLGAVLDAIPDRQVRGQMIDILERKLIHGQRKAL